MVRPANPYVAIHLAHNRAVLESNFADTRRDVHAGADVAESNQTPPDWWCLGMSWPLAIAGVIGLPFIWRRNGGLIAAMGVLLFVQFAFYAWNKPRRYLRFALFSDAVMLRASLVAVCGHGAGCWPRAAGDAGLHWRWLSIRSPA